MNHLLSDQKINIKKKLFYNIWWDECFKIYIIYVIKTRKKVKPANGLPPTEKVLLVLSSNFFYYKQSSNRIKVLGNKIALFWSVSSNDSYIHICML